MAAAVETIPVSSVLYTNPRRNVLGESPIYRHSDHTLHWIDLLSKPGTLHILPLSPTTSLPLGPARVIATSLPLTCIRFIKNKPGKYICATRNGIGVLDEESGEVQVLKVLVRDGEGEEWEREFGGWVMNDGAVDPQGRFWLGECDLRNLEKVIKGEELVGRGRLWRFDGDGTLKEMDSGVMCGNGIGWSPDGRFLFFNDSGTQILWRYDFDGKTGNISNKTRIIDGLPGKPRSVLNDGMVIDQEGNLWITMWYDHCVIAYSPEGKPLKKITFPTKCVTCPTWGGEKNNVLFVTSGQAWNEELAEGDEGGHVFKYEAGVEGIKNYEFDGNTGVARAASQLNRFKPKDIPTPKVTIQEVSTRALVLDSVTRYKYTEGRFSLNEL